MHRHTVTKDYISNGLLLISCRLNQKRGNIMEVILLLVVVGMVAGWLASVVIPNGYGLIGTIIVGIIGGVVAGYLLGGMLNITGNALVNQIISGSIGAIILLFILRVIKKA
jgi:uncharacterized membrane protein YeaQ/YmgE (transglycosylase-associated protein family)